MKIPASIRKRYADQIEVNLRLRGKADERIISIKRSSWHYESRLKEEQSFALKVESGRAKDPGAMEDFFASTLVVRNGNEIDQAETLIRQNFTVQYRRPRANKYTHKAPETFPFDDLRLYVRWKDDPALPPSGLVAVTFEIQLKTFLQHAWSIATHDLVYKSDTVSWSKQRIAFQIKAMLEHAEVSIQEAERLAECKALAKTDPLTATTHGYISLLTSHWSAADLPKDVRRLAENISGLMELMKFRVNRLEQALNAERARGRGPLTYNLSPYGVVLQTLLTEYPDKFREALMATAPRIQKIVIPAELQLPPDLDRSLCSNAIFL